LGGLEAAALDSDNLDNAKNKQTFAYSRILRYDCQAWKSAHGRSARLALNREGGRAKTAK
jgi:hypothetical protein